MTYPFDHRLIRPDVRESIDNYVTIGVPTGDFLRAVLANDLMEAVGRADMDNLTALPAICSYLYNEIPAACHGSYDVVDEWLKRKADEREKQQAAAT